MFLRLSLILLFLIPLQSHSRSLPGDWKTVGAAELSVLWIDVYQAELLTPEGKFENVGSPAILKITYRRDISQRDLIDETRKQIKPFVDPKKAEFWLKQLQQFWPDITEGDQLSFWIDEEGKGRFYFNQKLIGSITEEDFSMAFISIWLSDKSSYPRLARKLRGELSNERSE